MLIENVDVPPKWLVSKPVSFRINRVEQQAVVKTRNLSRFS